MEKLGSYISGGFNSPNVPGGIVEYWKDDNGDYIRKDLYVNELTDEEEILNTTEIKGNFINDLAFNFYERNFEFDFVDGVDWKGLCEHYGVEIEGSIGYDHPKAGKPSPKMRDYKFYGQVVGKDKYLVISKTGEHDLIDPKEAGHGVEFP